MVSDDLPCAVGEVVGGTLRLERVLGRGAMGVVYEATDLALGRRVALKMVDAAVVHDPSIRARLTREARAAAQLDAENVAYVYRAGEHAGMPFLVMELLEGPTLADLAAKRPITVDELVSWARQAARGLAEAHRMGLVHRDVKPGNLFLARRPDGTEIVKLVDFGIVRFADAAGDRLTATGELLGSPAYMSPEQVRGFGVDARADVWAMGVTFYELATGTLPFDGRTGTDVFGAILDDAPAPRLPAHVPPAFADVVARCLSKDPSHRFADGEALYRALTPPEARSVVVHTHRAPVRAVRRSTRAFLVTAAAVVVVGGVFLGGYAAGRRQDARQVRDAEASSPRPTQQAPSSVPPQPPSTPESVAPPPIPVDAGAARPVAVGPHLQIMSSLNASLPSANVWLSKHREAISRCVRPARCVTTVEVVVDTRGHHIEALKPVDEACAEFTTADSCLKRSVVDGPPRACGGEIECRTEVLIRVSWPR